MPRNSKPVPTENPVTLHVSTCRGKEGREREKEREKEGCISFTLSLSPSLSQLRACTQVYARATETERERDSCAYARRVVHRMTWRMSQLVEESFRENSFEKLFSEEIFV